MKKHLISLASAAVMTMAGASASYAQNANVGVNVNGHNVKVDVDVAINAAPDHSHPYCAGSPSISYFDSDMTPHWRQFNRQVWNNGPIEALFDEYVGWYCDGGLMYQVVYHESDYVLRKHGLEFYPDPPIAPPKRLMPASFVPPGS